MNTSMKKSAALLAAVMTMASVSGCGSSDDGSSAGAPVDSAAQTSSVDEENSQADEVPSADNTSSEAESISELVSEAESAAEPEPEPDPGPDLEKLVREVDVKSLLPTINSPKETINIKFDMDMDISSLFIEATQPYEQSLENMRSSKGFKGDACAFPEFSLEEVDGIPMIKISTDKFYDCIHEERDGDVEYTEKSIMIFSVNPEMWSEIFEDIKNGTYYSFSTTFLVKNKNPADHIEDRGGVEHDYYINYPSIYIGSFSDEYALEIDPLSRIIQYSGSNVQIENAYGTKSILNTQDICIFDPSDAYDVYIVGIRIVKEW